MSRPKVRHRKDYAIGNQRFNCMGRRGASGRGMETTLGIYQRVSRANYYTTTPQPSPRRLPAAAAPSRREADTERNQTTPGSPSLITVKESWFTRLEPETRRRRGETVPIIKREKPLSDTPPKGKSLIQVGHIGQGWIVKESFSQAQQETMVQIKLVGIPGVVWFTQNEVAGWQNPTAA